MGKSHLSARRRRRINGNKMNINKFLDKEYHGMTFNELKHAPFSAIKGVSESDDDRMRAAFKRNELSKFVEIADAIVTLAEGEE